MKLLLVGNHTCGNRGDAAILRGLLNCLRSIDENIEIDTISRYSISSAFLLNEKIKQDTLFLKGNRNSSGIYSKVKNKINNLILPRILLAHCEKKGFFQYIKLPSYICDFVSNIDDYDAVIQVGGSFFVDLYGAAQFEHIFCTLMAKKPIYLIGHSVGPFENRNFNKIAKYAFSRVNELILREDVSKQILIKDGFDMSNVSMGIDTAFLVDVAEAQYSKNYITEHWSYVIDENKTVALTVRKLAPFDKRLGVTQEQYEFAVSSVIEHIISLGYQVVIFSTCTGIESYNNDDRMIALSIQNKVKSNGSCHVVMDEINDVQLGFLLSKCVFTIGTRLHSAIISMNFGTPAIAINYEHKSKGIMNSLEFDSLAISVKDLFTDEITNKINYLHSNHDEVRNKLKVKIEEVKGNGKKLIGDLIKKIGEK
ncbi:TPA: colanic acid biosynthesis pyruvyl transferase WcaK [Raoultella ornithinolytica]|nr:colanic acid biosynthesis pyruvyl transferase WcaK [Raoultella ornithinolytica]